jgi:hypothetical protein
VQDTLQQVGVSDPAPEVPANTGSGEEEESDQ